MQRSEKLCAWYFSAAFTNRPQAAISRRPQSFWTYFGQIESNSIGRCDNHPSFPAVIGTELEAEF